LASTKSLATAAVTSVALISLIVIGPSIVQHPL
jgi:hypothetical protein